MRRFIIRRKFRNMGFDRENTAEAEQKLREIVRAKLDYRLFYLYKLFQKDQQLKFQLPLEIFWEIHKILIETERLYYAPENRLPIKLITEEFSQNSITNATRNKLATKGIILSGLTNNENYETYTHCGFRSRRNEDQYRAVYYDLGLVKIKGRLYVNKALYEKVKQELEIINYYYDTGLIGNIKI